MLDDLGAELNVEDMVTPETTDSTLSSKTVWSLPAPRTHDPLEAKVKAESSEPGVGIGIEKDVRPLVPTRDQKRKAADLGITVLSKRGTPPVGGAT